MPEEVEVREYTAETDQGRLCELWGNLCMIQQMRGEKYWMDMYSKSGLSWQEFIEKLDQIATSMILVFKLDEIVFGFTYLIMEATVASIKEFYIEPGYKEKIDQEKLVADIKGKLAELNIEYVEFDIKDLPV